MKQSIQWRMRIIEFILPRLNSDKEAVVDMIMSGLAEAKNEGAEDAAYIIDHMMSYCNNPHQRRALQIASNSIRELVCANRQSDLEMNAELPTPSQPSQERT